MAATRFLLCVGLLATASALVVADPKDTVDEKGVDRLGHKRVRPRTAYVASAALVTAATGVQVISPAWLKGCGAPDWAVGCMEALAEQKKTNPLGLTMGHGLLLKARALGTISSRRGRRRRWPVHGSETRTVGRGRDIGGAE